MRYLKNKLEEEYYNRCQCVSNDLIIYLTLGINLCGLGAANGFDRCGAL